MMTVVNLGGSKRVRKEPQPPAVDTTFEGDGSEQDPKLSALRRRKRAMTTVNAAGKRTKPKLITIYALFQCP